MRFHSDLGGQHSRGLWLIFCVLMEIIAERRKASRDPPE